MSENEKEKDIVFPLNANLPENLTMDYWFVSEGSLKGYPKEWGLNEWLRHTNRNARAINKLHDELGSVENAQPKEDEKLVGEEKNIVEFLNGIQTFDNNFLYKSKMITSDSKVKHNELIVCKECVYLGLEITGTINAYQYINIPMNFPEDIFDRLFSDLLDKTPSPSIKISLGAEGQYINSISIAKNTKTSTYTMSNVRNVDGNPANAMAWSRIDMQNPFTPAEIKAIREGQ